ncbi:MAG: M23 family metallopeptidase [Erythrobacter sp.]
MRWNRISAAAIGFAGLAGLVSCTGSEAAETESVNEEANVNEAVGPSAEAASSDAAEAAAISAAQSSFSYSGEMTQGGFIRGTVPSGTVTAQLGEQVLEIADDGSFFAAFDRDSASAAMLSATLANGQTVRETLSISPRDWNIERVNVARRSGGASEAFMRRRRPELDAIWNAREAETGADGWSQDFIWPVKGRISGRFGSQRIYRGEPGSYHSGIDIAPGNGVPFVAPADGVVVLAADNFSLEGKLLIIDHGSGLNSAFLHASRLSVSEGDVVKQGQYIGNIGSSGRATGPHLHWSIKWNNARLDPLLFVGPMN